MPNKIKIELTVEEAKAVEEALYFAVRQRQGLPLARQGLPLAMAVLAMAKVQAALSGESEAAHD